jgi:hypothetical protein
LSHPKVGDIDLVWGKEGTGKSDGFGLAKIAKYHPEVLGDLQGMLNEMRIKDASENRIRLASEKREASVSLNWNNKNKKWLLTAYEKETSPNSKTTNTTISNKPEGGDTALSSDNVSFHKDANNSSTAKQNPENLFH